MFRGLALNRIAAVVLLLAGASFIPLLIAIGAIFLAAREAHTAPLPTALTFLGYGQSTMQAPGTTVLSAGLTCTFSTTSGGQVTIAGLSGTPLSGVLSGAPLAAAGLPTSPALIQTTGFVSGTSGGNGTYSVNVSTTLGPVGCYVGTETTFGASLTGSNINSNAFMINTSPVLGPRAMWETLNGSNCNNSKPVIPSNWSGFALLKETAYSQSCGGGFLIETPLSSFVAQFIAQTGWSAPNAVVAANMAHGGLDWNATQPNTLSPGSKSTSDWTNLVTAQKYIKNAVQSNASALPGITGPWTYRLGGVPLRLGESAAAPSSGMAATAAFTTSSATIPVNTNTYNLNIAGWCVYDSTASAFIGYAVSWTGTTLTLQSASLAASSGSTDNFYISPCYAGYLATLQSIVAQLTASDVSDAPNPAGVPIFATAPSSTNFTAAQGQFQFVVNAAMVTEALADRRYVHAGPGFIGKFQSDSVHQEPHGNAMAGAYMGKWAAWTLTGKRTPPFAMISAQRLGPGSVDGNGSHYGVRVTFQMPPSQPCVAPGANGQSCASNVSAAQQQVLQFYSDGDIPLWTGGNYGFCYTDGAYPAGGSTFFKYCGAAASGISIASLPILATSNSYTAGGQPNQIDIALTGDPNTASNPTISLGAASTGNGITIWGVANVHLYLHNVANKDCTIPGNSALSGNAYKNAVCDGVGTALNYLIDFAAPSFIGVGQTLTTAW